ncbi:MAG: DUF4827 family protein [Paludibacter sp.]|nr:DUF4827 family protein [Paludibacter sp.]
MTKNYYLLVLTLLTSLVITSCSDNTTYADELKTEQSLIKNYIKRNGIKVISKMPTTWGPNDYVLTESGLYFHLDSIGDTAVTVEAGNTISPRYIQYTLGEPTDSIRKWTTVDFPFPETFVYGDATGTYSCTAFQEAVSYMKNNDSEAKIIVHSKIGFEANWSPATPIAYRLKIRIRK